ncbi:MAG TPA: hypothetical protein VGK21_06620 [Candidatus Angelobacter sp.]
MRKPAGIVLSLLFLAISVLESPLKAQQQPDATRVSQLAENKSHSTAQNVEHALALDTRNAAAIALERAIAAGVAGKAESSQP